jgi:hypothetical protein
VILAILAFGLILRLPGLSWGLPGPKHLWPYHPDESVIFLCMKNMTPSAFNFNPVDFSWPGLYLYLVMSALGGLGLLGILPLSPSEAWLTAHPAALTLAYLTARVLTLAAALAGVGLAIRLGEALTPRRGWMAGMICAALPVHVILSTIGTPHMLSATLSAAALHTAIGIPGDPRPRRHLATAVFWGLAVGALYDSWILVVPLFVAHLRTPHPLRTLPRFLATGALAVITFLLVNPYVILAHDDFLRSVAVIQDYLGLIRPSLAAFFFISALALSPPVGALAAVGAGRAVIAGIRNSRVEAERLSRSAAIVVGAWLIAYTALIAWTGTDFLRRLLPLAIPCSVLAVYALSGLAPLPRRILGALAVAVPLMITAAYLPTFGPADTRNIARAWIEANIPAGSRIGVVNWFLGPHLDTRMYRCHVLGLDVRKAADVEFLVATEREIPSAAALAAFPRGRILARFNYAPAILGWTIDESQAPEDWFYTHPRVYVMEVSPGGEAAIPPKGG